MSAHTPGPWEHWPDAVPEGITQITVYQEETGTRVATVFERKGNACLIAAAPDLLQAAKASIRYLDDRPEFEALRAAIAKAEG